MEGNNRKIKTALAQMYATNDLNKNFELSRAFIYHAAEKGMDLILFPEVQLTPFFAQYRKKELSEKFDIDVEDLSIDESGEYLKTIQNDAKEAKIMVSPNFYVKRGGKFFDTSFLIGSDGEIIGNADMVHIFQATNFYEQDYYTPSESGFKVFDTPLGKIGIVICFDRHLPESIRTCAAKGAELILIPTANLKSEPLEMFEWEIRTQAYQNNVFIAMCNRVGKEGEVEFAGESLIADPDGNIVVKADDSARMVSAEIDLELVSKSRETRNYLNARRKEFYL